MKNQNMDKGIGQIALSHDRKYEHVYEIRISLQHLLRKADNEIL